MARNTVAYGQHIALVPYSEEHVSIRQEWMKDPRNRLDDQEKEHTYEEEAALRLKWSTDPARVVFMIADVDKLSDPASRLIERFIGEAHYTLAEVDGATEAKLDVLILDQTVRRRTFLSEALLFLMQFGVYRLNVKKFVIEPGNPSPNRLIFAIRDGDDIVTAASEPVTAAMHRRSSVADGLKKVAAKAREAFTRQRTDIIQRLTRHLQKQDKGDHWPAELDFELAAVNRLELTVTPLVAQKLNEISYHAKFIKFRAMQPDGLLRMPTNTRINGNTLTAIPYRPEHVPKCHQIMQLRQVAAIFGISPPTRAEEKEAQKTMTLNPNCYSFVVCEQDTPGDEACPATIVGRAQFFVADSCQLFIGLIPTDATLYQQWLRETLLMALLFVTDTLFCHKVYVPDVLLLKPLKSDSLAWTTLLTWTSNPGTNTSFLDLQSSAVRKALNELRGNMRVGHFDPTTMKYVGASAV
eukprot:m.127225 g.127225  ORF g.127225 m.127225 type:complete len:467 (+) comp13851_c0_seq6:71-1471(+)